MRRSVSAGLLSTLLVSLGLSACADDEPADVSSLVPWPSASTPGRRPPSDRPRGSGAQPVRSTYSRACTTNGDCVLVSFATAPCDTCKCPNDAIAVEEQRRFFDEEGAYRNTCREAPTPCQADCPPLAARCVSGTCAVVVTGAPPAREAGAGDGGGD